MKNDSPNKFLGTMASRLQAALGIDAGGNPMRQRSGNILSNVGALIGAGTGDPTPAPMAPTGGNMQDPFAGKTFSIVESPANMKGDAKPVFNKSTSNAAAMMYGSPMERQMSMPKAGISAMAMSAKQAENLPPELVAEIKKKEAKEGSDGSSPVEFHEGVSHKYSLNAENYADSVKVAKRKQRFNEMMKPKMMKTLVDKSKVSTTTSAETLPEAQELPRIKRK